MQVYVFHVIYSKLLLLSYDMNFTNYAGMKFYDSNIFEDKIDGDIISSVELNRLTNFEIIFNSKYYKINKLFDGYILFPHEEKKIIIEIIKYLFKTYTSKSTLYNTVGHQIINTFHFSRSHYIVEFIQQEEPDFKQSLEILCNYLFCDSYVLLIFNNFTNYFSIMEASFPIPQTFFKRSDTTLFECFFKRKHNYKSFNPEVFQLFNTSINLPLTKQIFAIKIELKKDIFGILVLFSKASGIEIPDADRQLCINIIEWEFLYRYIQYEDSLSNLEMFIVENYKSGSLEELLQNLVCKIRDEFGYEACSILLKTDKKNELELIATCDKDNKGKPLKSVTYNLEKQTFTSEVYNTKSPRFSYDIKNDPKNSHYYNEKTYHEPKNWIGIPLLNKNNCIGVLRVKNKINKNINEKTILADLFPLDFLNLIALCNRISSIISINQVFTRVQDISLKTRTKYNQLTDFNNLFLHEIRNPISKFNTTPDIIRRMLNVNPLSDEVITNIKQKLFDIQVMGDRLKFITDKQNVEEIIKGKKEEVLSVMHDIVFPVVNITREYLRKQYEINLILEAEGLEGYKVYGDRTLLNLVLNSLIDNAAKYTIEKNNPVIISGKCDDIYKYFFISVSSYSYPIEKSDVKKIFDKGFRGSAVVKRKIIGTGIGLYISREIMSAHHGALNITSINKPVTFEIKIPYIEAEKE